MMRNDRIGQLIGWAFGSRFILDFSKGFLFFLLVLAGFCAFAAVLFREWPTMRIWIAIGVISSILGLLCALYVRIANKPSEHKSCDSCGEKRESQ